MTEQGEGDLSFNSELLNTNSSIYEMSNFNNCGKSCYNEVILDEGVHRRNR